MTRTRRALTLLALAALAALAAAGYLLVEASPPICVGVSACGTSMELTR